MAIVPFSMIVQSSRTFGAISNPRRACTAATSCPSCTPSWPTALAAPSTPRWCATEAVRRGGIEPRPPGSDSGDPDPGLMLGLLPEDPECRHLHQEPRISHTVLCVTEPQSRVERINYIIFTIYNRVTFLELTININIMIFSQPMLCQPHTAQSTIHENMN